MGWPKRLLECVAPTATLQQPYDFCTGGLTSTLEGSIMEQCRVGAVARHGRRRKDDALCRIRTIGSHHKTTTPSSACRAFSPLAYSIGVETRSRDPACARAGQDLWGWGSERGCSFAPGGMPERR